MEFGYHSINKKVLLSCCEKEVLETRLVSNNGKAQHV